MSVAIYSAHWATLGGGEKYVACIAEVLARETEDPVSLLIDHPRVDRATLERLFNVDLGRVQVRRFRHGARRELATARTCFVSSNVRSYGLPADHTVYVIQLPYGTISLGTILSALRRRDPREALKALSRLVLVRQARKASAVLVYSDFVASVLRRHHGIHGRVLYPPVDEFALAGVPKGDVILSVGRFFSGPYNEKRHDVLIDAFKTLCGTVPGGGWEYRLAGTCRDDGESRRYLTSLHERAAGYPIRFLVNVPYRDLMRQYAEATFFWHAAGFGSGPESNPERMEHFGMTTAEAMTAGCIPLVIGHGGQREIVVPGESGILWETPSDLVRETLALIRDDTRRQDIRRGALVRARIFSRERFARDLLSVYERLLRGA